MARDGTAVTDPSSVSVRAVAEDAWANVETAQGDLEVATDVRIVADQGRLQRLFENLFRNAIEHGVSDAADPATVGATTEEGLLVQGTDGSLRSVSGNEVQVHVEVGTFEDDPLGIYLADDGPGIPPEERDKVFESGYSTNEDGTGFGLTIVSQIAEAHGWDVRVAESESGGARFELTGIETAD